MRLRRPLPSRGPVAARWAAERALSRRLVLLRARGRCEGCDAPRTALEWHHVAGRRHLVSEPWASSPELTCALCPDCHRTVTRGVAPELCDRLRWAAVDRLALRTDAAYDPLADPLDVLRALVTRLEADDNL